jgi:hypothetical protein
MGESYANTARNLRAGNLGWNEPLKVLSSENQGGLKVVSIDRYWSSVFLFFLGFFKKVLLLLEPKLLVMSERIGEALKMVFSTYQFVKTWY